MKIIHVHKFYERITGEIQNVIGKNANNFNHENMKT